MSLFMLMTHTDESATATYFSSLLEYDNPVWFTVDWNGSAMDTWEHPLMHHLNRFILP